MPVVWASSYDNDKTISIENQNLLLRCFLKNKIKRHKYIVEIYWSWMWSWIVQTMPKMHSNSFRTWQSILILPKFVKIWCSLKHTNVKSLVFSVCSAIQCLHVDKLKTFISAFTDATRIILCIHVYLHVLNANNWKAFPAKNYFVLALIKKCLHIVLPV